MALILAYLLNVVNFFVAAFMILLILIQRGKGGGLIGALGGAGGSSPFGSRAGDQFTRLTIYVAIIWLLLTMIQVKAIFFEATGRGVVTAFPDF
ncbi:MAG: preprotein translocase subunit SecG [Planctomycetes bacterium]|nr:preprotein translocase subunit SecG [Planctomycetota bacterium]